MFQHQLLREKLPMGECHDPPLPSQKSSEYMRNNDVVGIAERLRTKYGRRPPVAKTPSPSSNVPDTTTQKVSSNELKSVPKESAPADPRHDSGQTGSVVARRVAESIVEPVSKNASTDVIQESNTTPVLEGDAVSSLKLTTKPASEIKVPDFVAKSNSKPASDEGVDFSFVRPSKSQKMNINKSEIPYPGLNDTGRRTETPWKTPRRLPVQTTGELIKPILSPDQRCGQRHCSSYRKARGDVKSPQQLNPAVSCKASSESDPLPIVQPHETTFHPLKDIKRWSASFFHKHWPELAEEVVHYGSQRSIASNGDPSQDHTRSLTGLSELDFRSQQHPNPVELEKWFEFIGQSKNRSPSSMPEQQLEMQLCGWDGDFVVPGPELFQNMCWTIGHDAAASIDRWIDLNVDLGNGFEVDTRRATFMSGESRPSGLLHNTAIAPPDLGFIPSLPDFEAIKWDDIPIRSPQNASQLSHFQIRQTANLCSEITRAPYMEKVAIVEMQREERNKYGKCLAQEAREIEMRMDPAKALCHNNSWTPSMNFYIRPARLADVPQIRQIYNDWIQNTPYTKEILPYDEQFFRESLERRRNESLPFLVAAVKSRHSNKHGRPTDGSHQRRQQHDERSEGIVGFTYADALDTQRGEVFRGVVEVAMFTHRDYSHAGIGKTLLDRIVSLLDPLYQSHRGTDLEVSAQDGTGYKLTSCAATKRVRKIVIDVLCDHEDKSNLSWKKEMLERKFGFHQTSLIPDLAEKNEKLLGLATFTRDSFETPGPRSSMAELMMHMHMNGQ